MDEKNNIEENRERIAFRVEKNESAIYRWGDVIQGARVKLADLKKKDFETPFLLIDGCLRVRFGVLEPKGEGYEFLDYLECTDGRHPEIMKGSEFRLYEITGTLFSSDPCRFDLDEDFLMY